ncbi:hypothetical protein Tco_0814769 [Tanacetum coccineum]
MSSLRRSSKGGYNRDYLDGVDRVQHETSLEGPILEDVEETIAREEVDLGISPPNTELDEGTVVFFPNAYIINLDDEYLPPKPIQLCNPLPLGACLWVASQINVRRVVLWDIEAFSLPSAGWEDSRDMHQGVMGRIVELVWKESIHRERFNVHAFGKKTTVPTQQEDPCMTGITLFYVKLTKDEAILN